VCNPYFEAEEDVSGDYLKNCFTSIEECRSHNYYYYNTHMLKCWNICPYYSTQIGRDGKPQEDFSRSTCVVTCGNDFPKYTSGTKICKKQCDNGEFYTLDNPNVCISKCNFDYIGEDNQCLEFCENKNYYFLMPSGKKKCVSKCKDYGRFYIEDKPNCYDACPSGWNYYNSDHRCLQSCLYDPNEKFYYRYVNYPQPCRSDSNNQYYYENKTIVSSCYPNYISGRGSFLCVENCSTKKVYENYCVSACPPEAPYLNGTQCVSKCGNYFLVIFKDECLNDCPNGYSKNNTFKVCYPNCKFGENLI
jgi:hypothetical protein